MLEATKVDISKDKFVKIFENSVQTKPWKSKYAAYREFCKNLGLPITSKNVKLLVDIRNYAETKTREYKYSVPMLKKLKNAGYKIGLLSNTSIFAMEKIKQKTRILRYINYILPSYIAGAVKPDHEIFKQMLRMAKVKPEESIMIGDKLEADVIPPRKLGMNAIHFKNYKQLKREFLRYGIRF